MASPINKSHDGNWGKNSIGSIPITNAMAALSSEILIFALLAVIPAS
jgi:hypothetical protein